MWHTYKHRNTHTNIHKWKLTKWTSHSPLVLTNSYFFLTQKWQIPRVMAGGDGNWWNWTIHKHGFITTRILLNKWVWETLILAEKLAVSARSTKKERNLQMITGKPYRVLLLYFTWWRRGKCRILFWRAEVGDTIFCGRGQKYLCQISRHRFPLPSLAIFHMYTD